jgi:hypothetical protein
MLDYQRAVDAYHQRCIDAGRPLASEHSRL